MKKILSSLLCAVVLFMLFVPVYATEVPVGSLDASTSSATTMTGTVDDLDKDGDGIPDFMDGCVDLDGDGVHDVDPTYQPPGESKLRKPLTEFQWIMVVLGCALLVVIVATLAHKYIFKKNDE